MNATAAASQLCLTDLFLKRVQMHPDKPALSHADRTLS